MKENNRSREYFGAWVRARRGDLLMTQTDLAVAADVAVGTISRIECGKVYPGATVEGKLRLALGGKP